MTEVVSFATWLRQNVYEILDCLKKDLWLIILVTLGFTAAGAGLGFMTRSTVSTAQIVLTPVALRESFDPANPGTGGDPLARMLARPADVKTVSLLCMSDEVLDMTRKALNDSGQLSEEIKSLNILRNSLEFQITIAKETPYETLYSPILELTAQAGTPADAKLTADTWAEQCVAAARKLQEAYQKPADEAFAKQVDTLSETLREAEEKYEAFKKENNLAYLGARLTAMSSVMQTLDSMRADYETKVSELKAMASTYEQLKTLENPKVILNWSASKHVLSALLGIPLPATPEETLPSNAVTLEEINQTYTEIATSLAKSKSEGDGKEAGLGQLTMTVDSFKKEITDLQARLAYAETEDKRLLRDITIQEEAYRAAALNRSFAQMANSLDQPQVQLLSRGAEWRMPRFQRAIVFGFSTGFWGLIVSLSVSVMARLVIASFFRVRAG